MSCHVHVISIFRKYVPIMASVKIRCVDDEGHRTNARSLDYTCINDKRRRYFPLEFCAVLSIIKSFDKPVVYVRRK